MLENLNLSERDLAVFRCIFNPTATIGDLTHDQDDFNEDQEPDDESHKESRHLCAQAVQSAEQGRNQEALDQFTKAIGVTPERAAAYNDRAQLYRILGRDEDALADIETVLTLTEGKGGRSRALSLCQKAELYRKLEKDQQLAEQYFNEAAHLGSAYAKTQLVALNPFAALCNQFLSKAFNMEDKSRQDKNKLPAENHEEKEKVFQVNKETVKNIKL